jgi:hypothetical protein
VHSASYFTGAAYNPWRWPLRINQQESVLARFERETFEQQAFDETTLVLRDEVLIAALDELASAVVAMMVLFAVVNVTIFLVFGGLAPRTHVSNDHGVLLTSTG